MPHAWEDQKEVALDASPEQVWAAVATGPGIDSWYMGHSQVEPGVGGVVRTAIGAGALESTVTHWEPPHRFAYRGVASADGRFLAFEFQIEGQAGGSTLLRLVSSGFLPGDDWGAEYDAMTKGGDLYFRTLVAYLTYFRDRTAWPISAYGPPVDDWAQARQVLTAALGLTVGVADGDPVQCIPSPGLPPIDGVVDYVSADCLGVRTADALYRFLRGFYGSGVVVSHHMFSERPDRAAVAHAWQDWLHHLFA
jgi:uncharacterized protein YndB with AHSA1/START domain